MTERAESRPTKEDWKNLGILSFLAGGGVGASVAGPVGAVAGALAGPALTGVAAITTEQIRKIREKGKPNLEQKTSPTDK